MKIETLEIHNYKVLQNVKIDNIGSMAVFLGENGVGKTTLFDVFGFMKSCLTENVRSALQARGGYAEVHSRDVQDDIYRLSLNTAYRPTNPCAVTNCIGENELISRLYNEGDKLGFLWKEGLFEDNL